jgi:hypothetical protein
MLKRMISINCTNSGGLKGFERKPRNKKGLDEPLENLD